MKSLFFRMALVVGVTINVVLIAVHLFMLYVLVAHMPDIIGIDGQGDVGVTVVLSGAIYLLPFAISLGLWIEGRSGGITALARVQVFTTASFYLTVLLCVVVCRMNNVWIDVN